MQCCGVYFRKGLLYVDSYSCDEFGIWVGSAQMSKVELMEPLEIGNAVIDALNASRSGISHRTPDDIKKLEKKMYKSMGVKNWVELASTSDYANLERKASVTNIYPHRIGKGGGFEPHGPSISCNSTDIEGIGRAVLKALKIKESK